MPSWSSAMNNEDKESETRGLWNELVELVQKVNEPLLGPQLYIDGYLPRDNSKAEKQPDSLFDHVDELSYEQRLTILKITEMKFMSKNTSKDGYKWTELRNSKNTKLNAIKLVQLCRITWDTDRVEGRLRACLPIAHFMSDDDRIDQYVVEYHSFNTSNQAVDLLECKCQYLCDLTREPKGDPIKFFITPFCSTDYFKFIPEGPNSKKLLFIDNLTNVPMTSLATAPYSQTTMLNINNINSTTTSITPTNNNNNNTITTNNNHTFSPPI